MHFNSTMMIWLKVLFVFSSLVMVDCFMVPTVGYSDSSRHRCQQQQLSLSFQTPTTIIRHDKQPKIRTTLFGRRQQEEYDIDDSENIVNSNNSGRRDVLIRSSKMMASGFLSSLLLLSSNNNNNMAHAAERPSLDSLLYRIVRVREATQQETRLINTGYFKDKQRANIKLAIRFMIENYRLNDAFVAAATYIDGSTSTRIEAGQVGQRAVQNLYTILEYFDSADVQNLKVGANLSGKDTLVLKGLDATRQSIDEFLGYFPKSTIDTIIAKVEEENELNVKEFDPALGKVVNMPITKYK